MAGRAWKRLVSGWGGSANVLGHEDGRIYRGVRSDPGLVKRHVVQQNEIVNEKGGGKGALGEYVGSVDMAKLHQWLTANGKTWRDFAVDEDVKAKFLVWYRTECSQFFADHYQPRQAKVYGGRDIKLRSTGRDGS